jgi:hypothetical protein
MLLESYFDIINPNDIRLRGTRIGIETVLYPYIHQKKTAEEIAQTYPQLALEKAVILYYLHDRATVGMYLTAWLNDCAQAEREQDENPPAIVLKLKRLREERLALAHG